MGETCFLSNKTMICLQLWNHIKLNKKTSQTSRKGRVKMASMNKNKKRDFKPYNRQGHR